MFDNTDVEVVFHRHLCLNAQEETTSVRSKLLQQGSVVFIGASCSRWSETMYIIASLLERSLVSSRAVVFMVMESARYPPRVKCQELASLFGHQRATGSLAVVVLPCRYCTTVVVKAKLYQISTLPLSHDGSASQHRP